MLQTVPLAEEYCKKTIRHLAGEQAPSSSIHTQGEVARPRGRGLRVTGGPQVCGLWCPPAAGLEAWCGDPLWLLETQVPLTPSIIHERMQLHNDSEKLPAPLELGCQAIN